MRPYRPREALLRLVAVAAIVALVLARVRETEAPASFLIDDVRDPLPTGWDAGEFLAGIRRVVKREARVAERNDHGRPARRTTGIRVHLLAWRLDGDEATRPPADLTDQAIAWVRVETAGPDRWLVAWVSRKPGLRPEWYPLYTADTPWRPFQSFDHPPRNAEIYALIGSTEPGSADFFEPGRLPFTAAVRGHTWRAVVAEDPTRFFP